MDIVDEQATSGRINIVTAAIRPEEIIPGRSYNGSNICAVLRFFIGPDYNQGTVFLKCASFLAPAAPGFVTVAGGEEAGVGERREWGLGAPGAAPLRGKDGGQDGA